VFLRPVFVQYPPDCENSIMGSKKLSLAKAVMVYPNPSTGQVTLGYALQNNDPLQVEVFNATGAKVLVLQLQNSGFGTQSIDLSKYGNGTYVLRLTNAGESITKRIVIAK
jgi:hypothetical protein